MRENAKSICLATWNLNNRVGKITFRPEAANAAIALGADVLVFTEYFPQHHHQQFRQVLKDAGWSWQEFSPEPEEKANRTLIVSRLPMEIDYLPRPSFDQQFPANIVAARLIEHGLLVLGVRVPYYEPSSALLSDSWKWLEETAGTVRNTPAVILGDLNVRPSGSPKASSESFHRILGNGWKRAQPAEGSSFPTKDGKGTEIDHVLATEHCRIHSARYVTTVGKFVLACGPSALSDHAALVAHIEVC
jgi:hypothetical protein